MSMLIKSLLLTIFAATVFLSIITATPVFQVKAQGAGYATIYVHPMISSFTSPPATVGTKFTVQARIHNYSQVAGYQVKLVYDNSLLNVTAPSDVAYAPDHIFPPGTYLPVAASIGMWNSTHQYVMKTACTLGAIEYSGADAGLLVITFTIVSVPPRGQIFSCAFWLEPVDTYTFDENIEFNAEVLIDGYYQISTSWYAVPTKVNLDLLPNPARKGQTVTLQGNLTTSDGLPIPDAAITIKSNGTTVATLATNSTGWFKASGQVKAAGSFNITAEFAGSLGYFPSSDWEILVVGAKSRIYFILVPNPVNPGKTCTLEGILIDEFSNPIKFATVTLAYSIDYGATWHPAGTLTTDSYGIFLKTFAAPSLGIYLLRISYAGSPSYEPSKAEAPLIVR